MAKVQGPLMSMEASGKVGGAIVFTRWKGRPVCRQYAIPSNPKSPAQVGVRACFKAAMVLFTALIAADKLLWKVLGDAAQITPANAFLKKSQDNLQALMAPQQLPTRVSDVVPASTTAGAAVDSGNKMIVTWTDPVDADLYGVFLYRSATAIFTPSPGNLIAGILAGVETYADTPGVGTWYYNLQAFDVDGNLSVPGVEFDGTIA